MGCKRIDCIDYDENSLSKCRKPVFVVASNCSSYLTAKTDAVADVLCNVGLDMPLFSKRKQISDDCEEWCRIHDVPRHPQNIITAALKLGLLQVKEHV